MRGSVQRRGDRWSIVWDEPTAGGKRCQRRKTLPPGATKADAERELARVLVQLGAVSPQAVKLTVGEWSKTWLETHAQDVGPSSLAVYERALRLHILPALGKKRLAELTPVDVRRFFDGLRSYSLNTLRVVRTVLRLMYVEAVALGYAEKLPTVGLRLRGQREAPRTRLIERVNVLRILDHMRDGIYWLPCVVVYHTGLRAGEVCALKGIDIDLANGCLYVRRGVSGGKIGPLKTATAHRQITLLDETIRLLEGIAGKDELVCPDYYGGLMRPGTLSSAFAAAARRVCGIKASLHDLRHTHASELVAAGVPLSVVAARLGHASVQLTMDVYSHTSTDMHRLALDRLREFWT